MNRVPTEYDRRYWNKLFLVFVVLGFAVYLPGEIKGILAVKLGGWALMTVGIYFGEKARDNEGWWCWVPIALVLLLAILLAPGMR